MKIVVVVKSRHVACDVRAAWRRLPPFPTRGEGVEETKSKPLFIFFIGK